MLQPKMPLVRPGRIFQETLQEGGIPWLKTVNCWKSAAFLKKTREAKKWYAKDSSGNIAEALE